jgi:hypothetical protein
VTQAVGGVDCPQGKYRCLIDSGAPVDESLRQIVVDGVRVSVGSCEAVAMKGGSGVGNEFRAKWESCGPRGEAIEIVGTISGPWCTELAGSLRVENWKVAFIAEAVACDAVPDADAADVAANIAAGQAEDP